MRSNLFLAICLCLGLGSNRALAAAGEGPFGADRDLIARFHFVGGGRIATDAGASNLNLIAEMPESLALREEMLQKLATTPYRYLQSHVGGTNDFASLMRPLVEDLLRAESCIEVRGPTNEAPELLLAVRLEKDRAGAWRTSLAEILTTWTGVPVKEFKGEGFEGWELQKHHQPNLIRFIRAGDWVLFGWGQGDIRAQAGMMRRIQEKKLPIEVPGNAWLDLQVDWFRLTGKPAALGPFKLAAMHLTVEGRKDFVRPQLVMQFAEPLGLSLKPWRIPTNRIRNPIGSFTAVRGLISRLNDLPQVKAQQASPLPDQVFIWAAQSFPFEQCLAAPVQGASNYLEQIQPGLVSLFNSKLAPRVGSIAAGWTNGQIAIEGLPLLGPYLSAVRETNGDLLLGGTLPSPVRNRPMPAELIDTIMADPRLVLYSWELTGPRLEQWDRLNQLLFVIYRIPMPLDDAAEKWINSVGPRLANCGTEITLTAPNELTVVRNSSVGFSSIELFWLAYWVSAPEFPLGAYGETARWRPNPPR
jgi:hypothetical protein